MRVHPASRGGAGDGPRCWDVIVVGSGIGGLVCAAYLAVSGCRVLVLEQHDVAGGNAHAFRRRRAYQFDVGVHYLGDCGPGGILPGILDGLGLHDRVRFAEMDRDGFDRILLPGRTIEVPVGWSRYRDRLTAALPADAAGIATFVRICETVAGGLRRRLLAPQAGPGDSPGGLSAQLGELRWARRSLTNLFDHCGLSPAARTALAAQSGNYGAAPCEVSVMTHASTMDHYLRGAYYPVGGGPALVAALVEVLEAHGGELRTRAMVRQVMLDDGGARGVELADGQQFLAPVVVSNADYRRTILELCADGAGFPPRLVEQAQAATMRLPLAALYLGLDLPRPDLGNANIWRFATEDIEGAYARLRAGAWDEPPFFVFISVASAKEPGSNACPSGHTNLQVMTLCPPSVRSWGVPDGPAAGFRYRRHPGYLAAKQSLTAALLAGLEDAIGPVRDHIVHLETATPLTQERYTLGTGGTPYGLNRWGPPGGPPDARPGVDTCVPGLYLAGQSTRYGSGIGGVAISGIMCAAQILGTSLLPEAYGGRVFADPSVLPERLPGWDALAVSRGRDRRTARGLARITN
jgi:all-trans-retinol 13,14-reductase